MKLFFDDLDDDCGALSLAARGAWMWILGDLHGKGGERSLDLTGWSRVIRANANQTATVLAELINTNTCDSNIENADRNALLQNNNALITVKCRRISRESKLRNQNNLRQKRFQDKRRYNATDNASITPIDIEADNQKQKHNNNYASSDESLSAPASPVFLKIPLTDRTEYPICQCQVDEWKGLYPAVDIEQELRNYLGWAIANPTKRKTRRGILSSINFWLSGKQNKGGRNGHSSGSLPGFKDDE